MFIQPRNMKFKLILRLVHALELSARVCVSIV